MSVLSGTHVTADPESIHALSRAFTGISGGVTIQASGLGMRRGTLSAAWDGDAQEGFEILADDTLGGLDITAELVSVAAGLLRDLALNLDDAIRVILRAEASVPPVPRAPIRPARFALPEQELMYDAAVRRHHNALADWRWDVQAAQYQVDAAHTDIQAAYARFVAGIRAIMQPPSGVWDQMDVPSLEVDEDWELSGPCQLPVFVAVDEGDDSTFWVTEASALCQVEIPFQTEEETPTFWFDDPGQEWLVPVPGGPTIVFNRPGTGGRSDGSKPGGGALVGGIPTPPAAGGDKVRDLIEEAGRHAKMNRAESPVWAGLKPYRGGIRTNGLQGRELRLYEWDHTHGDIEVYDRRGNHLGSMDARTGEMYKPPRGHVIDV